MAAGTSDYPTSLDTTTNLPAASTLSTAELDGDGNANVQHSNLHGVADTALVQLETKLGTGTGAPTAAGKLLRATSASASGWSTLTFPDTAAISTLIYASAADTLAALATANSGILITSGTGVPSISSTTPALTLGGTLTLNGQSLSGIATGSWVARWSGGTAITAAQYEITRDADGTNQLHFNVPTGATFEWSVNDVAEITLSATALNLQSNDLVTTGTIELGHATDTTLARSAAGTVQIEGVTIATASNTLTLTSKSIVASQITAGTFAAGTFSFAGSTNSDLGIVTTVDINGGTLDGVTIGGASAAAATVTTLTANETTIGHDYSLIVGHTASDAGITTTIELVGYETAATDQPGYYVFSNNGTTADYTGYFNFVRSRGTTAGAVTAVASGDRLGHMRWYGTDGTGTILAAEMYVDVDGAVGTNDMPGRWVVATTADGAASATERVRIDSSGRVLIGDTSIAAGEMGVGLVINGGAGDTQHLALKNSDVGHPMTDVAEADSFGVFLKAESTSGGLRIEGLKDADGSAGHALQLVGSLGEAADTTKTTAGIGVITLRAGVTDGAAATTVVGADGNLVVIQSFATARFIFDAEGSAHGDVEWVAFDSYDDLALIHDVEQHLLARESEAGTYNRHALEAAGIIGRDSWRFENGRPRAMVNMTKLAMLHHGALIQIGQRFDERDSEIAALRAEFAELRRALPAGR